MIIFNRLVPDQLLEELCLHFIYQTPSKQHVFTNSFKMRGFSLLI